MPLSGKQLFPAGGAIRCRLWEKTKNKKGKSKMKTTKATPRSSAKKPVELVRHGKTLTSLLTVYERMRTGELAGTPEVIEALRLSIVGKAKEIADAVTGVQS